MNWGKAVRLAVDNWEGRTSASDRDRLAWECTSHLQVTLKVSGLEESLETGRGGVVPFLAQEL